MMNPSTIALLLTSITTATAGQLVLKSGMNESGGESGLGLGDLVTLLTAMVTNVRLLGGLALFGLSAIFWLLTLSRLELSTAYPFVSLSYLIILGFSVTILGERPPAVTWGGAALIMVGIVLIGLGGFEQS